MAVAPHAPPQPTLTLETELPDQDEYEVRIYDERHGRRLVAAIELISPSNKDRPESRRAFVGKVAALLQRNVCVSLVDVVTIRDFNLYAEVLEFIGGNDPALESKPPCLYAVDDARPKTPSPAVVAGELVLPDAHRPTVADSSDLAGRRFEHRPGPGIQLRGNLPLPPHLLSEGMSLTPAAPWFAPNVLTRNVPGLARSRSSDLCGRGRVKRSGNVPWKYPRRSQYSSEPRILP